MNSHTIADSQSLYQAPWGEISLTFAQKKLIGVHFLPLTHLPKHPLEPKWQQHFDHYFSGSLKQIPYPPSQLGTPFQQKVWQTIATIPYGHTQTYGTLAQQLNTHPRAIGQACGRNPIPIIIPCHRVIAQNGQIGGFSLGKQTQMLAIKQFLLTHEQKNQ